MSNATTLADTLPSSIPKLDFSRMNWAIFLLHFQDAIEGVHYTPPPIPEIPESSIIFLYVVITNIEEFQLE